MKALGSLFLFSFWLLLLFSLLSFFSFSPFFFSAVFFPPFERYLRFLRLITILNGDILTIKPFIKEAKIWLQRCLMKNGKRYAMKSHG